MKIDRPSNYHLTQNFTYGEVIHSDTAVRLGIDNRLPEELWENAMQMAHLMERVRAELNRPIFINSWYRCKELNTIIGGSRVSAHMEALACDFVTSFGIPLDVCKGLIQEGLEFDQLIDEGTWTHIGLSKEPLRREILTARFPNGKVVYTKGLTG
jgi:zinc D-Ala-D-Ala carboxypeptidase